MNATTRHSSVPGSSRRSRRTGAAGPEGARLAAAAALTLALLLAACGGPLAGGDPTMVTARLSANVPGAEAGGLSPQGFPYDPASGAIASTVRVYVFDAAHVRAAGHRARRHRAARGRRAAPRHQA